MKKFLMLLMCFTLQKSFAQAYESKVDYNKIQQAAVVNEYNYTEQIVEKTLKDKLERMGFKIKGNRGFLIVSNAAVMDVSSKPMEYAFKIERKSKKERDITLLSAVINENGINTTVENSDRLKSFLVDLIPSIEAVNVDFMVNEQFNAVVKSQKKLKNLQDDQASMERRVRNLQDDLKKNAKDQEDMQKEITKQQEVLDGLKAKKTNK